MDKPTTMRDPARRAGDPEPALLADAHAQGTPDIHSGHQTHQRLPGQEDPDPSRNTQETTT